MFSRVKRSLALRFEQLVARGILAQLGVVAILVVSISLVGGLLIHQLDPEFDNFGEALWWAFEHMLVPEFIDGDDNFARRSVGTVLVVLCAMLFIGTVVAILVQWLDSVRRRLELGLTPISDKGHYVLLGWSSRTPTILKSIVSSQHRVGHYERPARARHPRLAVLVDGADSLLLQRLRALLGSHWRSGRVRVRSGSPLSATDMQSVDVTNAAVIVVPAADTPSTSAMDADTRTVKTLMSLDASLESEAFGDHPLVVAELRDPRNRQTLKALYKGPMEIIAGDEIIARIIAQSVRHPGLSHVYAQLLSDADGNDLYTFQDPKFVGQPAGELINSFPDGICLGVVRPRGDSFEALLNPPTALTLESGDRIALLAANRTGAAPPGSGGDQGAPRNRREPEAPRDECRRVLILGWNHRVPLILSILCEFAPESFEIDVASAVPAQRREKQIAAAGLSDHRLSLRQLELDYTVPGNLERVDPANYDKVILLPSERLGSRAESDARSILGYLLVGELLEPAAATPSVLVELADPENKALFARRRGEILDTPGIVSHMITRISLHRELRAVFDELFGSAGSEIRFRSLADYGLAGENAFSALQQAARDQGEIAIGIRRAAGIGTPSGGVELNPGRDTVLQLGEGDELIVVTTPDSHDGSQAGISDSD